jgi:hypothetical protein
MNCPRCQHENPPHAKFCLECGLSLTLPCAKCHTTLPAGARFCLECGEPVTAGYGTSRFAAPDTYTPKHLAEKILTSKTALEGERKQVTVLFADLKGSMELLADRDPEEARKLLDSVLALMMEAVHHFEGIVNEARGDGIMALFGAPLAHEDQPIGSGHVVSLARPDGNITGIASMMPETTVKALELLTEAIPGLSRVAVIWDPATPSHGPGRNAVEVAGAALKLQLQTLIVRAASEYESAFATISRDRADAVLVLANPLYLAGARRLAELAIAHKLASIFTTREFAEAGGLLAYGPDRVDLFRRGAVYVDKVLKGAKPADLPVEQASKYQLVINLRTAKTLGLTILPSVVARADEVIE